MEKRMIFAIVLSILVLLGFQLLAPKKEVPIAPKAAVCPVGPVAETPYASDTSAQQAVKEAKAAQPLKEETAQIQTEKYNLTFSDVGASLKKLVLSEYQRNGDEEVLISQEDPAQRMFAMRSGFVKDLDTSKFKLTGKGANFLEYQLAEEGWMEITKRYTFYNSLDYFTLDVSIKNLSNRSTIFSYQIIGPSGIEQPNKVAGRSFLEADAMIDEKIWKVKAAKNVQERAGSVAWTALKNRYFALILKPFTSPRSVTIQGTQEPNLLVTLNSKNYDLAPGATSKDQYLLYAGPLNEGAIGAIGPGMESVVDYGFFGGLSKFLLATLRFFYKGVHNWGLAIICLTVLINAILFPLTFKSFASMQKMKKIQPHMQKLRALHKDNPQKLNKEMMDLYKQYNVNPIGGCLPLLLQMPIFISLYQGLMRSIELKGAHFLWIKDLARPDAVPLPFKLPLIGSSVNILPLLMVGVMALQQKLSQGISAGAMTEEQASQQRMMMLMMPVFFGFIFYGMPSGLVLYWLTNTILMTSEQSLIGKRMSGE